MTRPILTPCCGALAVALSAGALSRPAEAQTAAMFRGDAAHTGFYAAHLGSELVGLQWRFETGGAVVGSPAVLDDTVWIGSADGWVYALDRRTGTLRWKTNLGSPISSSPAVAAGRVFLETRDGRVHALRASKGTRIWRVDTGPDLAWHWGHESGDQWTSSPVLAGDLVLVGSGNGSLYAIEARSGRVRWRAATTGRVRSSPAVDRGRVYVGSADGYLHAFDLATGRVLWRYATLGTTLESGDFGFDRRTVQSSPAVAGDLVFVGARDGFLYAVSADSGTLRWSFDHKVSWVNASPAVADGVVYVGTSDGRFVQAVDATTGAEIWRTPAETIVWSSAAVAGNQLLVGDGRGRVRSYDRSTGRVRWAFGTAAPVYSSPVPAGRLVIFGSGDGGVYAIRTGDTAVRRAVFADTTGPVRPAPDELEHALELVGRGYTLLDAAGLDEFLRARIADRAPSVVVFPTDLPPAMQSEPPQHSLLRRYLDAGGKVVWATRFPPLLPPIDPATGKMTGGLGAFHWDAPGQLLGMKLTGSIFDQRMVRPTEAGRRWGLWLRWRDGWGIEPAEATEVLALDDWGLAACWVKSFGGAPGTGYVRAPTDDVQRIYDLAEYRPAARP